VVVLVIADVLQIVVVVAAVAVAVVDSIGPENVFPVVVVIEQLAMLV
jgi:hypothetical protein